MYLLNLIFQYLSFLSCVLVLYNQRRNKQTHIINSLKKPITACKFSKDGKYIVTGEVSSNCHSNLLHSFVEFVAVAIRITSGHYLQWPERHSTFSFLIPSCLFLIVLGSFVFCFFFYIFSVDISLMFVSGKLQLENRLLACLVIGMVSIAWYVSVLLFALILCFSLLEVMFCIFLKWKIIFELHLDIFNCLQTHF